jgi:hypothetical protein
MTAIPDSDRQLLRQLAGQVRQIAERPQIEERRRRFIAHNALRGDRPLVLAFPEGSWQEMLPASTLQCTDELMRHWELDLRRRIYWWQHIKDDNAVEPTMVIPWVIEVGDYGVTVENFRTEERGSFIWKAPIQDLGADFEKLHFRRPAVDRAETARQVELAGEIFAGLLETRLHSGTHWTTDLTRELIMLIGLEKLMLAMLDEPENLHRLMTWMRDEHQACRDWMIRENLLTLNTTNGYVGSGGAAYTDELPQPDWRPGQPVRPIDIWGFAESQETVGISPAMFGEFIFPYQLPLLKDFGLNCYGCCEPVHERWGWLKQIPHLRRVSISPWCNEEKMAELMGKTCIFSRKPNPAHVSVGFNEPAIRADLHHTLAVAGRLPLELIMKDTHTVQNEPDRIGRWVAIAREEIEKAGL